MARIRYLPEVDTLIISVGDNEFPHSYIPIDDDVEVGVNVDGSIVELRIEGASRKGLFRILEMLRRKRRRLAI